MKKRVISLLMAAICCVSVPVILTSCKGGSSEASEITESEAKDKAERHYKDVLKNMACFTTGALTSQVEAFVPSNKIKIEEKTDIYYKVVLSDGYCLVNGQRYQDKDMKAETYYIDRKTGEFLTAVEAKGEANSEEPST